MKEPKKNIIRRGSEKFVAWCADKSDAARVERTLAQAVLIGIVDAAAAINGAPAWVCVIGTTLGMPLLTIIMAEIGKSLQEG